MPNTPVSLVVNSVAYEFKPEAWAQIAAGQVDAPMPVLRHLIAEQKVLLDELRAAVKNLESELLKATDENLALRLKRGKGRVAP